jgi:hypothetical protein
MSLHSVHELAEHPGAGRLGRHVNHDLRSLAYAITDTAVWTTVMHERTVGPFNQGNVGSCVGNAKAGCLATAPFWEPLHAAFPHLVADETLALQLYTLATQIDPYPGQMPAEDTGSDGLSGNKAATKLGYQSGYVHALSVEASQAGLMKGPGDAGINWYDSFDEPDSEGIVRLPATAKVRGGHEIEKYGYDSARDLFWFWNSWGSDWGLGGKFAMEVSTFERLLHEDGDVTYGVPLNKPAPTPQPPEPSVTAFTFDDAELGTVRDWYTHPRSWKRSRAAAEIVDAHDRQRLF